MKPFLSPRFVIRCSFITLAVFLALAWIDGIYPINQVIQAQAESPTQIDSPDIIGGKEATPGAYPWQAALVRSSVRDAYAGQFCGGTLVGAEWVLTAAHCVDDRQPGDVHVVLGRHRLSDLSVGERISITQILLHPLYTSYIDGADLALLQLVRPSTQRPVPLDAVPSPLIEQRALQATVVGWGMTENLYNGSDVLREVGLPLVDRTQCNALEAHNGRVKEDMICAGHYRSSKTACYGDSGGPMLIPTKEEPGWMQVGIVSWGPAGCVRVNRYGVFVRVATYSAWVQECIANPATPQCLGGDAYEPDDQMSSAIDLPTTGITQTHTFHHSADRDWFKFTADSGVTYAIETMNLGENSDTILWLYDVDGITALLVNDDAMGNGIYWPPSHRASYLGWRAPQSGTYYLQVESRWLDSRLDTAYTIRATALPQPLFLPLIER